MLIGDYFTALIYRETAEGENLCIAADIQIPEERTQTDNRRLFFRKQAGEKAV